MFALNLAAQVGSQEEVAFQLSALHHPRREGGQIANRSTHLVLLDFELGVNGIVAI
jgi:hypothetical protein